METTYEEEDFNAYMKDFQSYLHQIAEPIDVSSCQVQDPQPMDETMSSTDDDRSPRQSGNWTGAAAASADDGPEAVHDITEHGGKPEVEEDVGIAREIEEDVGKPNNEESCEDAKVPDVDHFDPLAQMDALEEVGEESAIVEAGSMEPEGIYEGTEGGSLPDVVNVQPDVVECKGDLLVNFDDDDGGNGNAETTCVGKEEQIQEGAMEEDHERDAEPYEPDYENIPKKRREPEKGDEETAKEEEEAEERDYVKGGDEIEEEDYVKEGDEIEEKDYVKEGDDIEEKDFVKEGDEIEEKDFVKEGDDDIEEKGFVKEGDDIEEKDFVKEGDEIEEKDFVKEGDEDIEEKGFVKEDEDDDADMTDAVPANEHKDFYASISLTENFTEEVVGVEETAEEKETVPEESDAVPDMDNTLMESRDVDEQVEEPEEQQCDKLVDFETEPDAPVASGAAGMDADVCDTHADEIEVLKYIPEPDILPGEADETVEEEGCVVGSSNQPEVEEYTEQKQDLHDEVKSMEEEITPPEEEEETRVEQKDEEEERNLPPAANTSPSLTETDNKEAETTSPTDTSPPQTSSPRKTSPQKTSPHKTLEDRFSTPHESYHPKNNGCVTSPQPHHETADAQPEVVDRLPEQGSVKALLAQWREIERQKLAKQNLEETSVIDFCDDGEDFHRRDNRSRSCGPMSRQHGGRLLSPRDEEADHREGGEEGRTGRSMTRAGVPPPPTGHGDHYKSQPSLTKAIMAKFEHLDMEANTTACQVKKRNFKWQVKEPKILNRPGFPQRTGC